MLTTSFEIDLEIQVLWLARSRSAPALQPVTHFDRDYGCFGRLHKVLPPTHITLQQASGMRSCMSAVLSDLMEHVLGDWGLKVSIALIFSRPDRKLECNCRVVRVDFAPLQLSDHHSQQSYKTLEKSRQ